MSTREPPRENRADPGHGSPAAGNESEHRETLPGTAVSSRSWAQFQRRMQLRREATCVGALRRAMDAGEYAVALERANELCEIDHHWKEVELFLDYVVARAKRPAARVPPVVASTAPEVRRVESRRRPRRRLAVAVTLVLVAAMLGGWTLARVLPLDVAARWMAPLFNDQSARQTRASQRAPAEGEVPADVPQLPLAGMRTPAPLLPRQDEDNGNGLSQNRQAVVDQAPSPAAATPNVATRAGTAATANLNAQAGARAMAQVTAQSERAATPTVTTPETTRDASRTPAMSGPPTPPVSPNTAVEPPASTTTPQQQGAADTPPAQTAPMQPVPPLATPAVTSSPPPAAAFNEPARETTVPSIGTTAPADPWAPGGPAEREADEGAIDTTLGAYAQAYTALNAAAVRRVWPTVNAGALDNAFGQLESQRVAFNACSVDVRGLHASATCRGTATYVPKVGSREPISVSRVWRFSLRKRVDAWVIESVR